MPFSLRSFLNTLLSAAVLAACIATWTNADESAGVDAVHRAAYRFEAFAEIPGHSRGMVIYGTNHGYLRAIEQSGDRYREVWTSPSLVTRITDVETGDFSGNGGYGVAACNSRGTIYVYDTNTFQQLWQSQEGFFNSIEALAVGNVDGDPHDEILFLTEGQLYAYDGHDFAEDWRTNQVFSASDIVIGDVDGDDQVEIVLGSGHVLDAFTRRMEWESPTAFGTTLELADVDGDGILELIASTNEAMTIWDIDERREKWD